VTGPVRTVLLQAHGEPPVVADRAAPPDPDAGQCVVAVRAAPITPLDVLCATGTSYFGPPPLPYVPGVQGVGTVVAHPQLAAGTRVWFPTSAGMAPGDGSMATAVLLPAGAVVPLPDDTVADTEVAALGLSAVAAWTVLTRRAGLRPGEQVLVLGAGGVVGQVAVQAARLLGARRVVAAARSDRARQRAETCGADAVVPLADGDTAASLEARIRDSLDGPLDVVVDPLCGNPATAAARLLGEGGRLVNLGSSAGPTMEVDSAALRSRTAAVLGYTNNAITTEQRDGALLDVLGHAAAGRLRVDHEVVPLDLVGEAWARQADGSATTRLVVDLT
jgi:NADPH:quinone reductase-like Zn-dependent oxidoreductase